MLDPLYLITDVGSHPFVRFRNSVRLKEFLTFVAHGQNGWAAQEVIRTPNGSETAYWVQLRKNGPIEVRTEAQLRKIWDKVFKDWMELPDPEQSLNLIPAS